MTAPTDRAGFDPQRVEAALSTITPRWTAAVAHAMAFSPDPMLPFEILDRVPVPEGTFWQRMTTMKDHGLLHQQQPYEPYQLTEEGCALRTPLMSGAMWSRINVPGWLALPERSEDTLARLAGRGTATLLHHLADNGPSRFTDLPAGPHSKTSLYYRVTRMSDDGLLARAGRGQRAPYALSRAGERLLPVLQDIDQWAAELPAGHPALQQARVRAAQYRPPARAAVALRRSDVSRAPAPRTDTPHPSLTPAATAPAAGRRGGR